MKYLHTTLNILILAAGASTVLSYTAQNANGFAYSFVAFLVLIGLSDKTQTKTV